MEKIKDFTYCVKEGMVVVNVYSLTYNIWKYVTTEYFEKRCILA